MGGLKLGIVDRITYRKETLKRNEQLFALTSHGMKRERIEKPTIIDATVITTTMGRPMVERIERRLKLCQKERWKRKCNILSSIRPPLSLYPFFLSLFPPFLFFSLSFPIGFLVFLVQQRTQKTTRLAGTVIELDCSTEHG